MLVALNSSRSGEEVMEKAGLDWLVEQTPIITANGLNVDNYKALFRGDNRKVLDVVGDGFEVVQNSTFIAFAEIFAQQYGATFEYAGIIGGGKKVFCQLKLNKAFEAVAGDVVESYLTIVNGHGASSLRAFLTPVRLFCMNQMIRAIRAATTNVVLRHTSTINDRLRDAQRILAVSMTGFHDFQKRANFLARKIVDKQMVNRFLDEVIEDTGSTRSMNQRDRVRELFETGKGNTGKSAWHLYNAAVEWVDHERTSDPEKALDSRMFGSGALLKEKAFSTALSL